MNLEVIEFYPIERNDNRGILTGTLRVKLPDIGIHILGIYVSKVKDRWFFSLPSRSGKHHETSEPVRYPFIAFEEQEKQRELMQTIREKGIIFIEKRLSEIDNTSTCSQRHERKERQPQTPKQKENTTEVKETIINTNAKPTPQAKKEWITPQPLKKRIHKSGSKR